MSTLSPERWQEVSPYLDQVLSLPEDERAVWMASFRAERPGLADLLKELLQEHHALAQSQFLESSPIELARESSLAGQKIGAYTLISPIGQGGMGSVWLAERSDGRFERRVAMKFFCGFTFAEIAAMKNLSERTIQRQWDKARIYLHRKISKDLEV